MTAKKFGFDLDNTLIDYSQSTFEYCKLNNLPLYTTLKDLRKFIKYEMKDDENWQAAQAWLYTDGLNYAFLKKGANEFFKVLAKNDFDLSIVSHKTSHTQEKHGSHELHFRVLKWLSSRLDPKFFKIGVNIFLEPTKYAKIQKIRDLKIDYFVDDLLEVLVDKNFPRTTKKYLLSSEKEYNLPQEIISVLNFKEICIELNLPS